MLKKLLITGLGVAIGVYAATHFDFLRKFVVGSKSNV